jgi:hypothetical protein
MSIIFEEEAAAVRTAFDQGGEFVAAVELRRRFPFPPSNNSGAFPCPRDVGNVPERFVSSPTLLAKGATAVQLECDGGEHARVSDRGSQNPVSEGKPDNCGRVLRRLLRQEHLAGGTRSGAQSPLYSGTAARVY